MPAGVTRERRSFSVRRSTAWGRTFKAFRKERASVDSERLFNARMREVERQIRGQDVEHVRIVSPDGEIVYEATGTRTGCSYPGRLAAGNVVIHNHPTNESFSRQDVRSMIEDGAVEFRVVTDHHRYTLRTPSMMVWEAVEQRVAEVCFEETKQLMAGVRDGTYTPDDAGRALLHQVWERIAPEFGWQYRREDLGP